MAYFDVCKVDEPTFVLRKNEGKLMQN